MNRAHRRQARRQKDRPLMPMCFTFVPCASCDPRSMLPPLPEDVPKDALADLLDGLVVELEAPCGCICIMSIGCHDHDQEHHHDAGQLG